LVDEPFSFADRDAMEARLEELRERHRALDEEIQAIEAVEGANFRVMALKREKLRLRDRIAWLASRLTPDIIA
jgi:hypothetical protein